MIIKMPDSECMYGQLYLDQDKFVIYQVNDLKIRIFPNKKIYALIYNQDKNFMKCIHEMLCKLDEVDRDNNMFLVLDLDKMYVYNDISMNVRKVYETNPNEYTTLTKKLENTMYLFRTRFPIQLNKDHYLVQYKNRKLRLSVRDLALDTKICNSSWLYYKCHMYVECIVLYLKKVWRAYNDYLREIVSSTR